MPCPDIASQCSADASLNQQESPEPPQGAVFAVGKLASDDSTRPVRWLSPPKDGVSMRRAMQNDEAPADGGDAGASSW